MCVATSFLSEGALAGTTVASLMIQNVQTAPGVVVVLGFKDVLCSAP